MVESKPDTMLAEYDDDTLATMSDELAKEAERLGRLSRGAFEELKVRILERGATKLETPHWTGAVKPGAISHTVDDIDRFLWRLTPLLTGPELDTAFVSPPPPKLRVDHRGVNELYKRGGDIAAIIDEERNSVRGDERLVLERKPEVA